MPIEFQFGTLQASRPPATGTGAKFRLAVLGDFSARANRGLLETGDALAARKAIKVDCDNFDKVLQRLQPKLALPFGTGSVEIPIASLDDFHPDQLYGNLEIFSELASLRQRLKLPSQFAKAAAEMQKWPGLAAATPAPEIAATARGAVLPADGELSDFAALMGQPAVATGGEETSVGDLIKSLVAPFVVPAKDPRQDPLIASVDEALSATMRLVLHHPDFQALESLWRSLDLLVRRVETGPKLEIVLIDLTAEELAADLSGAEALETTGLYRLLAETPAADAAAGPYSAVVAYYTFSRTRAQAELLGRASRVVAAIPAPFIAAMSPKILEEPVKDLAPELTEAWGALGALPEAGYLALLTPSFLLRQPYGRKSEPVDAFDFEEVTPATGLHGFLWGNPASLAGLLLGQSAAEKGAKVTTEGAPTGVGELPFYFYTDKDGDQVALPCTEKLVTSRESSLVVSQGFIPVVSLKGSPEVRLGSWQSLAGKTLAGPWAPIAIGSSGKAAPAPTVATPEVAAPEVPAEAAGDPELDALLAGLDLPVGPAPEPPPPPVDEPAPPAEPEADLELDALLAGLDTPAEPAPEAPAEPIAEEEPAPEEPAEPAEEAASEPAPAAEVSDPDLDALLGDLPSTPAEAEAAVPETVEEPALASVSAPETSDPDLDALLGDLPAAPGEEPPSPPAADPEAPIAGEASDPELDALLGDAPATPAEAEPEPELQPEPAATEPPPEAPVEAEEQTTGDPDLDALIASLSPEEPAAPASSDELDPELASMLEGL